MKKRIGAILLTLCLLAGLLPTTALAGGDVATFFIGHDFRDPEDVVCTAAGDEILLPGTHVVSVWETDYVEIDIGNDNTYEVRVPFNQFIAGDPNWSISWRINYNGQVEDVASGKVTSITVDCPRLEEGEKSYRLYVYATLTATYEGTPYTVTGSTSLFIQDPIWKLPKDDETVHVVDRNGQEDFTVPLTLPDTLIKHTSDNPAGTEVPMPDNFTVAYEVYDGNQQVAIDDAALNDPHPGCYRVYTTIKDQDGTSVVSYNQYYFITEGDVLARQNLTDTVTWTLTKDGALTFRGNGEVPGRGTSQRAWEEFVSRYQQEYDPNYKITKVVVEEGITTLGSEVLSTWNPNETLDSVTLPSTLTKLENYVFQGYNINSATYAGDSWASVIVGDGNENLNSLLVEDGITLWVENGRLYGRFTAPKDSEPSNYDIYRLYFYDSTKTSDPDYIYAAMASPDITIDLTDMYGYGTLDHFAVYQMGDDPEQGDEPLYDVALAKPIQFQTGSFAFPAEDVTVSVEENTGTDSQYYPYSVTFSNLDENYLYELDNQDTRYSWKFEGNSVSANDKIFGACTLTAIYARSDANSYWIVSSTGYPLTITEETQPALPEQNVMVPGSFEKTYGDADFYSTATNTSDGGGALTYASSNTDVVAVDENSGKVTIKGAGKATITVTAAAVPGKYAETSASYTVTVQKAALKITADNTSTVYGQPVPSFSWSGEGWKYQDNESAVAGQAVYACDYKTYAEAGTYPISVSGLTARNYNITFETGTLTVNKATEYAITLDKLEQLACHTSDVTAQITPYDATAQISVEYQVENQWVENVPTTAGSYNVRAALTDSDNIEFESDDYTYDTLVVKQGVTVNTGSGTADVDVAVNVGSGKAEITVEDSQLEEILTKADGTVSIDLGGVSEVDQLVLPGKLVRELSKSDKADGLTVSTEDASVTLSAPVLDTVAKKVTNEKDTISIRLESVAKNELKPEQQAALDAITSDYPVSVVEVALVVTHSDGSEDVFHELGSDVTVTVPYEPGLLKGQYVVACYLSDDGTVTYLFAKAGEDGRTITFTTNHFSHYAVFVGGKPSVQVNGGSKSGLYNVGDTVSIQADSKMGYTFDHWEVRPASVVLANKNSTRTTFTMPAEAVELTAVYVKDSGGSGGITPPTEPSAPAGEYLITVDRTTGGKVTVNPGRADRGDEVTVTAKPNDGYVLESLTVTAKNGGSVKLTRTDDNRYTFTMPGGAVEVTASFGVLAEKPALSFSDVCENDYYYEAVAWAAEQGVTNGIGAAAFGPDITVTRAQMVTFLWRAHGSPSATGSGPFTDVSAGDYYYDAVLWAVSNGVTNGTGPAAFSPDAAVTRAQAVTFQWRAAGSPAASGSRFDDVAANAWYADAVTWAMANGVTNGTGGRNFSPETAVSRAQAVTFLWRAMSR